MFRYTVINFTNIISLISMSYVGREFTFQTNDLLSGYKYDEALISELVADSVVICTQRCLEHSCTSMTFNNITKECRTHGVRICNTINGVTAPFMTYYSMPFSRERYDCKDIGCTGTFTVKPLATTQFNARCEDGWTVFQYRHDGSVNFHKTWNEYKNFFGDLNGEFWLGNENINALTSLGPTELMIQMTTNTGLDYYARYRSFSLGNEASNYKLSVSGYSGNAGDSLAHHNGAEFSSPDRDNDKTHTTCSTLCKGGWWYQARPGILCYKANLNGRYGSTENMYWYGVSKTIPMKTTKMMIRRL